MIPLLEHENLLQRRQNAAPAFRRRGEDLMAGDIRKIPAELERRDSWPRRQVDAVAVVLVERWEPLGPAPDAHGLPRPPAGAPAGRCTVSPATPTNPSSGSCHS